MKRLSVAMFNQRDDALALQRRLNENGIPSEIHDEVGRGKLWYVGHSIGVRLEVPAGQFERAHHLLVEWDASEHILKNAIRCPECRSLRVDYPQFAKNSVIPNIVVGALAAIGHLEKEYYCEDCHFTWPREGTRPSLLRPHSAPYYFIEGIEQTTLPPSERKTPAA